MDSERQKTDDFYVPDDGQPATQDATPSHASTPIQWSASEFLYHQKSASWYLFGMMIIVAASLLLYVLTREPVGPVSVVVLGVLLFVGAAKKPRTVEYLIDRSGIVIGKKEFAFDDFQSFSIVHEDQIESIALFPHKRFAPVVSLYFSADDAQKIFDLLSDFLPFEQREKDQIDKFLHKIRF